VKLGVGDFFGEMGLISGRRRTATVRAGESGTVLIETPRKQIVKLMASVNSVRRSLDEVFMLRALQTSIFPEVERSFLEALVKKAKMKSFKKGDVLFNEGDIGDALYVIRKGSVKISRRNRAGVNVAQTYIPAGRYVGEMSILTEKEMQRTATVSAAVGCETIVIEKSDFLDLLRSHPAAQQRISRLAQERNVENVVSNWDEKSGSILDFMTREGLTDAENVLLIDSDLCVACDNCEAACASTHGGHSRLDRRGGKSFASIQLPISCRHCENPLCMLDCPPDALTRLSDGEVVIRDSCIGCGNCVGNCPYGVIHIVHDEVRKGNSLLAWLGFGEVEEGPAKAAKCDQCHSLAGGPACVRACPTGAAMRVNAEQLVKIAQLKRI
jgi:Fe-S-cluster-containing hydrogenase component 2/CRP-like cAMP-binding protein